MKKKNKNPPENPPNDRKPINPIKPNFEEIEVNMLTDVKTIETFKIKYNIKTFEYDNETYKVNKKMIKLIPSKDGFNPTLYYVKEKDIPLSFENKNVGIPSRALRLIWEHSLYKVLVALEKDRTNLIIIIVFVAGLVFFGISLYFRLKSWGML